MTSFALPNNIFAFVPAWHFLFALPPDEQVVALQDPAVRARLRAAATDDFVTVYRGTVFDDRHEVVTLGDPLRFPWDGMVFVGAAPDRFDIGGRSIGAEARATGRAPVDVLLDKVVETKAAGFFYTPLSPYSADRSIDIMSDPRTVLSGNDTGAHLQRLSQQGSTLLLGRYVRELGTLSLEHAVHQLTGRQAAVFCLPDRGVLAPGMAADVVLFDEQRVDAMAPEVRADLPGGERRVVTAALGVERVIVNGVSILAGGQPTGARPGRFLRPADMLAASAAR
jgi:N-acyl-D-aspartate/D-glutamate deacylase